MRGKGTMTNLEYLKIQIICEMDAKQLIEWCGGDTNDNILCGLITDDDCLCKGRKPHSCADCIEKWLNKPFSE